MWFVGIREYLDTVVWFGDNNGGNGFMVVQVGDGDVGKKI